MANLAEWGNSIGHTLLIRAHWSLNAMSPTEYLEPVLVLSWTIYRAIIRTVFNEHTRCASIPTEVRPAERQLSVSVWTEDRQAARIISIIVR